MYALFIILLFQSHFKSADKLILKDVKTDLVGIIYNVK